MSHSTFRVTLTYLLPAWYDVIVESVRTVRHECASEVSLDILGQLTALFIGSEQWSEVSIPLTPH